MKLKNNLMMHMNIKKQIFRLLRMIKQLLIHKLFIHLDYLILIQQVLTLSLIGMMRVIRYFSLLNSFYLIIEYSCLCHVIISICQYLYLRKFITHPKVRSDITHPCIT